MEIGELIQERYRLEQILGHGGMGTTYKAIDLQTEDHCRKTTAFLPNESMEGIGDV